jgi:hypothetical protein
MQNGILLPNGPRYPDGCRGIHATMRMLLLRVTVHALDTHHLLSVHADCHMGITYLEQPPPSVYAPRFLRGGDRLLRFLSEMVMKVTCMRYLIQLLRLF